MKEKTKKNILQACLGLYWGFNLIALLIYEIYMKIFLRDKSAKDSSDEGEYAKIFWYLISIPFISIVVLLFSKVDFISLFPIFNVVYGAGIVTTAAILIFSKDSIYIFDKEEGEFLSNYKDFGNVLLMDIVWQIISLIVYIFLNFYSGLISHIFIALFLSWGFYTFKKTYSGEKKLEKIKKISTDYSNFRLKNLLKWNKIYIKFKNWQ